jgi:carboxypeptidase C (cathepsin A)
MCKLRISIAKSLLLLAVFACLATSGVRAQESKTAKKSDTATAAADDKAKPNPLPPDASIQQTAAIGGKTLHYTVTVGTFPVKDKDGIKTIGEVVYTAYTMAGEDRPVTFALNGGPGASSVYLNFGAIGPKRVAFGMQGDSPSDPPTLKDNPGSWLPFTDLVFIDPIGTGFSRSLVPDDQAKKDFYNSVSDIEYLSRIVYDWLVKYDRLTSRKYLVGESYGGFRGPRVTYYLQSQLGVALNGVVLVSPYLNPSIGDMDTISPLPWMLTLPSITAAHLEREGKLTADAMAPVIAYTRTDYAIALMKGHSDPAAYASMIQHVIDLTGLDPNFVRQSGGRLDTQAYLREVYRTEGKIGSVYDSNVTAYDPFPYAPDQMSNDPLLDSIIAPTTEAMVNFITHTVGWKTEARYNALSYDVNRLWARNDDLRSGSTKQLREAVAADPKLRVLIAHGWNDLSCPFMGSILTVDEMPIMGDPTRVQVHEYPGGHMFYTRPGSQEAFLQDVEAMFAKH